MYHTLEAQKVLDDDSSKILLFFTSSAFTLSMHYKTLSHTYTTTELQLLKKGAIKSWFGPLIRRHSIRRQNSALLRVFGKKIEFWRLTVIIKLFEM